MTVPRNRLKMAFDEAYVTSSQQQVQNRSAHPQSKRSSHAATRENNNRVTCMHFPVLHVRKPHIRAWSSLMVRQSPIMCFVLVFVTLTCGFETQWLCKEGFHFNMWGTTTAAFCSSQFQLLLCCFSDPLSGLHFSHSRYCQWLQHEVPIWSNDPAVSHAPCTPATSGASLELSESVFQGM